MMGPEENTEKLALAQPLVGQSSLPEENITEKLALAQPLVDQSSLPEENITEKLALAQWLVDQSSPSVGKNPPDWLRKAIEEHFNPRDPSLVTYSVPEAGRYLGLGRSASYLAARTSQIPTLRIRGKLRVPRIALLRILEEVGMSGADQSAN